MTLAVFALTALSLNCTDEPSNDPDGGQSGNAGKGGSPTAGVSGTTTAGGNGGSFQSTGGISAGGNAGGGGTNGNGGSAASSGGNAAGGQAGGAGSSGAGAGGIPSSGGNGGNGGAGAQGGSGGDAGTPSGPPAVRFVGRMDRSDSKGPRFSWSGSGIVARFEGSAVGVKLSGGQQYTVVLDGLVKAKLTPTNGTTPIAEGLAAGPHTVELYRRTEANLGESQFLGFDFGGGALLAPPAAPARRLEFVGDSITCGYGNEGTSASCTFTPDTENHYSTYAALAARSLNAESVTVAWSGKGVVCNYGDDASSCADPLPGYYERALAARADSKWDFSSWQPQAVIVNLGTNDFSTAQDPTQSQFEGAYKTLLQNIRRKNPTAYILCTNGPMLGADDLSRARTYIANVVKSLNDAGDGKVKSFELAPQNAADGLGCDYHPSLATHQKLAAQVVTALQAALGW